MNRAAVRAAGIVVVVLMLASPVLPVAAGSSVVRVSRISPYAGCKGSTLPRERLAVNGEVEPWVSVDPSDPNHLVGAWQQDRYEFGGAKGLAAAASFDGGSTWKRSQLPFSRCAVDGIHYQRASDPWVSIGPDGTVYAISISFQVKNDDNGVFASASTDGGVTWNTPVTIHENVGAAGSRWFDDKESVTADPTQPGVAYAVWDRGGARDENGRNLTRAGYSSPVWFSITSDGGVTWSPAEVIDDPGPGGYTIGSQIVVDPNDGTLYDVFTGRRKGHATAESVIVSTDGGTNWSAPHHIARDLGGEVSDPTTGEPLRAGTGLPDAAVDPNTGDLYVVWGDSRFSSRHYSEIAMTRSTDGGVTWSPVRRVSQRSGMPAFTPSVEVLPDGTVGVSYYQIVRRAGMSIPTVARLATFGPGGKPLLQDVRLVPPFPQGNAPLAGGRFLGDYEGLAVTGTSFDAFFVVANRSKQNRTDVVSVKI